MHLLTLGLLLFLDLFRSMFQPTFSSMFRQHVCNGSFQQQSIYTNNLQIDIYSMYISITYKLIYIAYIYQ